MSIITIYWMYNKIGEGIINKFKITANIGVKNLLMSINEY